MNKFLLCSLFYFVVLMPIMAQNTDTLPLSPAIRLKGVDSSQFLGLADLAISVRIVGNIATTTMDMNFYNNMDRVMEGELNFPLAENQAVTRFALDVNGKLREGVTVEKQKGRVAYENTIRQRIDPGLLEMTEGNNFRTRVYPLNPQGYKRAVIAYQEELKATNDNGKMAWVYRLPLNFTQILKNFSLQIQVVGNSEMPFLQKNPLGVAAFQQNENGEYTTQYTSTNSKIIGWLNIGLPINETKEVVVTGQKDATTYFLAQTFLPKDLKMTPPTFVAPKKVLLCWDISHSAKNRNIAQELNVLDLYLQKIQHTTITLLLFNNKIQKKQNFVIKKGVWDSLRNTLKNANYDGGTQLGLALQQYKTDETWLFTDGLSTFGKNEIKLPNNSVYVFSSSLTANYSYLRYVAQTYKGAFFDLTATTPAEVLAQIVSPPLQYLGAKYDQNTITAVYPTNQTAGQNLTIYGKLKAKQAQITLQFGWRNQVIYQKSINIQATNTQNPEIPSLWAAKKVAFLDQQAEKNEQAITALGKEFSLVTRYTSLIVLDRIEDYIRYNITPPAELQEEYKKYQKNMKRYSPTKVSQKEIEKRQIDNLLYDDWSSRLTWWGLPEPVRPIAKFKPQTKSKPQQNTRIVDTKPILQYNPALATRVLTANAVFGQVIAADDGTPIPGATVMIKGTTVGTQTDVEGNYAISVDSSQFNTAILVISFVGMKTVEVKAKEAHLHSIALEVDEARLAEVVVTGLGVVTPSIDENSVLQTLQGRATGVQIAEGNVGSSSSIRIRGASSISTTNQPLFVIDGVPMGKEEQLNLNPKEIMNIEILKGNAAVALYGSRAVNGVILITTKKGQEKAENWRDSLDTALEKAEIQAEEISVKKILLADAPYLDTLDKTPLVDRYLAYLRMKKEFGDNSAYYLDVSNFFVEKKDVATAITVLSTLTDLEAENHELMRIVARRLQQLGRVKEAIPLFEKVLKFRGDEPHSYRDLALAHAENGQAQKAVDLLYPLLIQNSRFDNIKETVLYELNHIIATARKPLNLRKIDKRIIQPMPVDIRVTLEWSHDDMDIDLYLVAPNGEECYYGNKKSFNAYLSADVTNGYGPEEILLKKAPKGKYTVKVDYYADRVQKKPTPLVLQVTMYMHYGTAQEVKQSTTIRLDAEEKDNVEVGSFILK